MSTQKQIKANRQNAQKSTGPKTTEGKATVSKNAIKHGLFAAENVINGENPADYEAFHDSLLAELEPDGIVETLLAERVVNLWWRLKRAERMQNQAIDHMIIREVDSPLARHIRQVYARYEGFIDDDKRNSPEFMPLGRVATRDFANNRALERMMLYERRIENSLLRLMKEYNKQQIMRRIEQQDETIPSAALGIGSKAYGFEAATRSQLEQNGNLKKQSQFVPGMSDISPYKLNGYGDILSAGDDENKPNKTCPEPAERSQFDAPFPPEWMQEMEKPPTAATG